MPDYQVSFDVQIITVQPTYSTVSYSITNIGSKDLTNATIDIGVKDSTVLGASAMGTASTPSANLNVGETISGTVTVNYSSYTGGFANLEAYVISAGWDKSIKRGPAL